MRTRRAAPAVIGLDLSLTRPAAVFIPPAWRPGDWCALRWWAEEILGVMSHEDDRGRAIRMIRIAGKVREFVLTWSKSHAGRTYLYAEDYAFSMGGPTARKLAEAAGAVRVELFSYGRTYRAVSASTARKLLLGKLPRGKGEVKLAVQRALFDAGAPRAWRDDECDAFTIANWGLAEHGSPALVLHDWRTRVPR